MQIVITAVTARSALPCCSYLSRNATKLETMRARWAEFRTPSCFISASQKYINSSTPMNLEKLSAYFEKTEIECFLARITFISFGGYKMLNYRCIVTNPASLTKPIFRNVDAEAVPLSGSAFCLVLKIENSMPYLRMQKKLHFYWRFFFEWMKQIFKNRTSNVFNRSHYLTAE